MNHYLLALLIVLAVVNSTSFVLTIMDWWRRK